MPPRVVDIHASDEAAARQQAAKELSTTPDNIRLKPLGDGRFRAQLQNADAVITVALSPGDLEVFVEDFSPPVGNGKPINIDAFERQLRSAGIVVELDRSAIESCIRRIAEGADIKGTVLAVAEEPKPPEDGHISLLIEPQFPVLPGMAICRKIPAKEATPGQTVRGTPLPYPEKKAKPRDVDLTVKSNAEISEDGLTATATVYGLANVAGAKVEVTPLYRLGEENLALIATVYAKDGAGNAITAERLKEAFERAGYPHGFDAETAAAALSEAAAKDPADGAPGVAGVVLMRGTEPKDGKDGRFESACEETTIKPPETENAVDFHELGGVRNVHAGQVIGRLLPPEPGLPGCTISGATLAASDGVPVEITVGENIDAAEDGTLKARIDGVLVRTRNHIAVTDLLEIKGDIDFNTGNIRLEKGSVEIAGTVRTGFAVEAPGTVTVGEAVEGAVIKAGGDIQVHRGVIMHEHGRLEAGGSLFALFAENAEIHVGGDVVIANDIANCQIVAHGKVLTTEGKGKIMGGRIQAGAGIEANEIGSEIGVATELILGIEDEHSRSLLAEKAALEENIQKIQRVIGDTAPAELLRRTPPAKRVVVAQILKARIAASGRLEQIKNELEHLFREKRAATRASIRVEKDIHPGVQISIAGRHLRIGKTHKRCEIFYDRDLDEIRIGPL